jgi:hypothetical protein
VIVECAEHRFDALAERRDRRIDHDPALFVRNQPLVLLVLTAALGHVLMDRDPAAVGHHPARDRDHPAVRQFADVDHGLLVAHPAQRIGDVVLRVSPESPGALAMGEQVAQQDPRLCHHGIELVDFDVAIVAQHEPRGAVEHAEALRHVVEGGVETCTARADPPRESGDGISEDQDAEQHDDERQPMAVERKSGKTVQHVAKEPDQVEAARVATTCCFKVNRPAPGRASRPQDLYRKINGLTSPPERAP